MSSKILAKVKTLVLVFDHTHSYIALIRETEGKDHWKDSLNAIGGHVEMGEDIYKSAQRECREELGISFNLPLRLLGFMNVQDKKGITNIMFAFTTVINRKLEIKGSDEGEVVWFKISDLSKNENIVQDIKIFVKASKAIQNTQYITGSTKYLPDGKLEYIQICKQQQL